MLANKCAGGRLWIFLETGGGRSRSANRYSKLEWLHLDAVCDVAVAEAHDSLQRAREEVREHYSTSSNEVIRNTIWVRYSLLFGQEIILSGYEISLVILL